MLVDELGCVLSLIYPRRQTKQRKHPDKHLGFPVRMFSQIKVLKLRGKPVKWDDTLQKR